MQEKQIIKKVAIPLSAILLRLIYHSHVFRNTEEELLRRVKTVGWPDELSLIDIQVSLTILIRMGKVTIENTEMGKCYHHHKEDLKDLSMEDCIID